MFILGLTGQTGAGKSFAARRLAKLGFSHVDADKAARAVVAPGKPCLEKLREVFGNEIICEDGSLDRRKLAELAFSGGRIAELNAATHPFIMEEIKGELENLEKSGALFAVLDAPALFESGADKLCDKTMAVTAPQDLRLERIMKRDRIGREQALSRICAQHGEDFYTKRADFVVKSTADDSDLLGAVDKTALLITAGSGGICSR